MSQKQTVTLKVSKKTGLCYLNYDPKYVVRSGDDPTVYGRLDDEGVVRELTTKDVEVCKSLGYKCDKKEIKVEEQKEEEAEEEAEEQEEESEEQEEESEQQHVETPVVENKKSRAEPEVKAESKKESENDFAARLLALHTEYIELSDSQNEEMKLLLAKIEMLNSELIEVKTNLEKSKSETATLQKKVKALTTAIAEMQ